MLTPRLIPVLLLRGDGLVKTHQFSSPVYVGDPINAVRIFNEKEVDELIVLDITATRERRGPNYELVQRIASECFMPLAYGGAISTQQEARRLFSIGVEKVVLNSSAIDNLRLITEISTLFGSQAVVGAIDFKRPALGKPIVIDHRTGASINTDLVSRAMALEAAGAGEIFANSVDRDGTRKGYLIEQIRSVADAVSVPVIACGGANDLSDIGKVIREGHASAAAAGAMFVFHGKHRAVLITYPTRDDILRTLSA